MQDIEFVEENGHMVVKGLLTMLLELRQANATLHNLSPDGIYVSTQGTRLVVTDLFAVTFRGMRVLEMPTACMPYSNHGLRQHELTGFHDQERTLWAVGVIILELFVGQDLIQCLRTHDDVQEVLVHLSTPLGSRIYNLLRGLLLQVRFDIVGEFLQDGILDNGSRMCKALRDVAEKKKHSTFLEDMLKEGRDEEKTLSDEEISVFGQASAQN